jgi:hypothetical protein
VATHQRLYLNHTLDDPWMARLLARHGLTGGRFTIVVLLLFEAAGLPLPVVRDFLGTLGELNEPRSVLDRAAEFVTQHQAHLATVGETS